MKKVRLTLFDKYSCKFLVFLIYHDHLWKYEAMAVRIWPHLRKFQQRFKNNRTCGQFLLSLEITLVVNLSIMVYNVMSDSIFWSFLVLWNSSLVARYCVEPVCSVSSESIFCDVTSLKWSHHPQHQETCVRFTLSKLVTFQTHLSFETYCILALFIIRNVNICVLTRALSYQN